MKHREKELGEDMGKASTPEVASDHLLWGIDLLKPAAIKGD